MSLKKMFSAVTHLCLALTHDRRIVAFFFMCTLSLGCWRIHLMPEFMSTAWNFIFSVVAHDAHATISKEKKQESMKDESVSDAPLERQSTDAFDILNLSPQELKVLEYKIEQQKKFEKQKNDLNMQRAQLQALEISVNKKIKELQTLQASLKKNVDERSDKEQKQLDGLVKIYAFMKPAEAARILIKLSPKLVIDLIERMPEQKASAILAQSPPEFASFITSQISLRSQLISAKSAADTKNGAS